jgi:predicted flap endonuclease-1-like 5' DNA nuclease
MGYFLQMTWPWWLLVIAVAVLIIWLIFRDWQRSRQAADRAVTGRANVDLAMANARIAELEAQLNDVPALKSLIAKLENSGGRTGEPTAPEPAATKPVPAGPVSAKPAPAESPSSAPDMTEASAVLGFTLKFDDLAVVEGIGPKIQDLLYAAKIRTWHDLAQTDVEKLRQILHYAGPHYRIHEPATWPRQAELLDNGEWERFKEWTDELKGGREVTPV